MTEWGRGRQVGGRVCKEERIVGCFRHFYNSRQQLLSVVFSLFLWPWELGSGSVSLATKCMTVVRPGGSFKAPRVTLPCRKRPWKMRRRILGLLTCSSSHPKGQLSKTCLAMSVAESLGEKVKSCVFPLTRIRRRFTMSRSLGVLMVSSRVLTCGRKWWAPLVETGQSLGTKSTVSETFQYSHPLVFSAFHSLARTKVAGAGAHM